MRTIRFALPLLCLAGLLTSCSGDGGDSPIRVTFGINGPGSCGEVVVDVDLDGAFATLERNSDDTVDCVAASVLDNDCDVSFVELAGGSVLRARIGGCSVSAIEQLFECNFDKVDLSLVQTRIDAECDCQNVRCDPTPPACAVDSHEPFFCEDCSNGVDDDGDRLVDCQDANCEHSYACSSTTSLSSTTVTSTSTSTTRDHGASSTSTSTTTLAPPVSGFTLTYAIANAANIGSLEWDTNYGSALATTSARAAAALIGSPECTSLVPGASASFVDDTSEQTLHASITGLDGEAGKLELAECTFESETIPTESDFSITVTEARDTGGNVIAPPPPVEIDEIVPVEVTTTTLEGDTTTTTSTTTTTVLPGTEYLITFRVASASAALGALQLGVNYASAPGVFSGSGSTVACTSKIAGALFAPNDFDSQKSLKLGIISLDTFSAPVDVIDCTFLGSPEDPPAPSDFDVDVEDATDGDGATVTATMSVKITTQQ